MDISNEGSSGPRSVSYTQKKVRLRAHIVTPGEFLAQDAGFLRGHGTFVHDGKILASVSGVVERVNKLISVRPIRARYQGEIGDIIVGRITEVGPKRWKVDINSRQDAALLLSSINLPGGVQRRRTYEDQLNMRNFFVEGDLISAEVQQFFGDGLVSLHTRSLRYGKLDNGMFLSVSPALIKRQKLHFINFAELGVDVILGNNGYIWISEATPETQNPSLASSSGNGDDVDMKTAEETKKEEEDALLPKKKEIKETGPDMRLVMSRIRNAILALNQQFIAIYPATILDVYTASISSGVHPRDMLNPEVVPVITKAAAERKKTAEAAEDADGQ